MKHSGLRRLDAFSHFSESQIATLTGCGHRQLLPAGETLYEVADTSAAVYAIAGGELRERLVTPFGEIELGRYDDGRLLGEIGFLGGHDRHAEAYASSAAQVWVFPRVSLDPTLDRDRSFAQATYWALWRSLSHKLRRRNRSLQEFFLQTASPTPRKTPVVTLSGRSELEVPVDLAARRKVLEEQPLSNLEVTFLASLSHARRIDGGEMIFREGDAGDAMYVVLDGSVVISKFLAGAGIEALAVLGRGEIFGEMALIDHLPRSADAVAHEEGAIVLAVPPEVLQGLLDIEKFSSVRLLKILCGLVARRLHATDDKLFGWFMMTGGDLPEGTPPPVPW